MSNLDIDDLLAFAKKQFGIRPTPLQLEMIKNMFEGKNVQVAYYHRQTGKTTMIKLAKAYDEYLKTKVCPNIKNHTPSPDGYLQWHEWAERKARTHRQIKCEGCGLYAIWKKST